MPILALFGAAFLFGVGAIVYLQGFLPPDTLPWGVDVYSNWLGARAIWLGRNPYSAQITAEIQQLIYQRPTDAHDPAFRFFYPAYLAVVLAPILPLSAPHAALVWCAAMWATLCVLAMVWSWEIGRGRAAWLWGALVVSLVLFRPAFAGVYYGQYSLFVLGCGILASWLAVQRRDAWAGALWFVVTIKPSIGVLAPLTFLLWAIRWRRWRIVFGFAVVACVLLGISFAQIGWWIPDLFAQMFAYNQINQGEGLAWSPNQLATPAGWVWLMGALFALGAGVRVLWRSAALPWLAILGALNLNLALTPHTVDYDLTMLLGELFWLGVQWRVSRVGLTAWFVLAWLPWLSWLSVLLGNGTTTLWWKNFWQFYPSVLLAATLGEAWRQRQRAGSERGVIE